MSEEAKVLEGVKGLFEQFKQVNDELLAKKASGEAVSELESKLAKMEDGFKSYDDEIAELKRKQTFASQAQKEDDKSAEQSAFFKLLHKKEALSEQETEMLGKAMSKSSKLYGQAKSVEEIKTMMSGVDTSGGVFVPVQTEMAILKMVQDDVALYRLAEKKTTGTSSYERPAQLSDAGAHWVGETTDRTATKTPDYGKIKIDIHTAAAAPEYTQEFMEDAGINLEAELMSSLQDSYTQLIGSALVNGSGNAMPYGLLSYATQDQKGKRGVDWGKLGFVTTGKAGSFADAAPADALIDLVTALKRPYHNGAAFLMNSLTLASVRKLKDSDGDYLWRPSIQEGVPATLLGYRVEIDEYMPSFDTSKATMPIAFGNFGRGYLVVNRRGMKIIRDIYTKKPLVVMSTDLRLGGGVQNYEAIKLLKASV